MGEQCEKNSTQSVNIVVSDIIKSYRINRKVSLTGSNVIKMRFQKKWLTTFSVFALN